MPIIRAVNGIIETYPSDPVSPRPPATRVPSAGREDHSKGQERQTADHAARLAQQAYQQQTHQATEPAEVVAFAALLLGTHAGDGR